MRTINVIRAFGLPFSETLDKDEDGNPIMTDGPGGEVVDPDATTVKTPTLTNNGMVDFQPGIQEVSDAVAEHWYTKANSESVEVAAAGGDTEALKRQLADVTEQRDELQARLDAAGSGATEALEQQLADVTEQRDRLQGELDAANARADNLQDELRNAAAANDQLGKDLEAAKASQPAPTGKLADVQRELAATKTELEDTKRQLADANAAVDALTAPDEQTGGGAE